MPLYDTQDAARPAASSAILIDTTVRNHTAPWMVDLATDIGDEDGQAPLILSLGTAGDDYRSIPVRVSANGMQVEFSFQTLESVRALAVALSRVADAMELRM